MSILIIPRLDIKGPNLVKGIHLEGLRVLGKPEKFAQYYYESGADELIYMDVVASLYGRNNILDIVTTANMIIDNEYHDDADQNSDGIIDVLDVVILINLILGNE